MEAHAFDADPDAPGEPFAIALPPPNVTGSLHMGHALNGSVQDALIRLRRMQGRNVLWQAGTDHAGIATQTRRRAAARRDGDRAARRSAARRSSTRCGSGARRRAPTIIEQYKRLGSSMDYRRERFTMDDDYARAVIEVFLRLHERGYIYRDSRLVNWSWPLQTAISDLEVEHREVDDVLYSVRYDVEGGGEIVIATVRPVTMLADTGVAVHPDDPRWNHLIGRTAIVPLVDRPVPIVADERVELGFGTGGLKVTPGHDPVDFEIGRDHGLETLLFMDEQGRLRDLKPEWEGLSLEEGHEAALAQLRAEGRIVAEVPLHHSVGFCQRSGARVEPIVSLQWFCRMDELADTAMEAVAQRAHHVPPEAAREDLLRLDGVDPALVRLAPAVVGPPAARLVRARRLLRGAGRPARGRRLGAVDRRARHVVLVGAVAVRDARLARRHAGAAHAGTPATCCRPPATSSTSGWRG